MNNRRVEAVIIVAVMTAIAGGIFFAVVDTLRNPEARAAHYDSIQHDNIQADHKVEELETKVKKLSAEVERLKKSQAPER